MYLKQGLAKQSIYSMITLPSQHQPGDEVEFKLPEVPKMYAWVTAVRFYQGKVKYDLELTLLDKNSTRIYNVDSVFVEKFGGYETT